MFGMFNKKAKEPSPYTYEAGLHGDKSAVYAAAARANGGWPNKVELLKGCTDAFDAGRPDNLCAFLTGYLEFKRAEGFVAKSDTGGMDEGFINLLCDPVMLLLEKQKAPRKTLDTLSADMSDYYKQIMLDLVLRRCCMTNGWMIAQTILDAGANPDAGNGRALFSAARKRYAQITTLLLQKNANVELARLIVNTEGDNADRKNFDVTITIAQQATSSPAEQQNVIEAPHLDITPAGRTTIKKPSNG